MTEPIVDGRPRKVGAHEVGPLACGLWRLVDPHIGKCTAVIEAALTAGMNLIDNADVYGFDSGGTGFGLAEQNLGKVLAASPSLRDQMVIATKRGTSCLRSLCKDV